MPERYIGKSLGKYRIDELIGSGGFAWVYRGYDPELEIPVALKVLKPQFAGDPVFEERFRREASTAARLRHPNIVTIYAVGRQGDAVYFAMDYLPSGLAERLETSPTLPEEFVVRVGIDVARALGFAHREGVIHRDIKVDNILFDSHGNAVVCDFGIARAVSGYTGQTGTNMVVGTPQYFAPEQARAKPLDGRADIYSLGVSLFRAATGRLPFDGDDWYEIARQHVEDAPPSPRDFNPALSPAFERTILRCLAKHPDDRPATGEQLADELAAVLHGGADASALSRVAYRSPSEMPTLVTPVGLAASGAPASSIRPRPLLYLVAAAVVVALVLPLVARRSASRGGTALAVGDSAAAAPRLPGAIVADTFAGSDSGTVPDTMEMSGAQPPRTPRDTARRRPAPTTGRLSIEAPSHARLLVNNAAVGDGSWRADTMAPGNYLVSASVSSSAGCESATAEERVRVRAGGTHAVRLQPRECGTLQLNVPNATPGARYTLMATEAGVRREGTFPLTAGIILPAGSYTLRVQQAQCALYEQTDVVITADRITPLTFRLMCGSA